MIKKISLKIAKYVIPDSEASESNIEIISYGAQAIISTLVTSLFAVIIALFLTNKLTELLLFSIAFIPIRFFHKGYHCQTFSGCIITSNLMILCITCLSNTFPMQLCILCIPPLLFLEYWLSVEKKKKYAVYELIYLFSLVIISEKFIIFSFLSLLVSNLLIIGGNYNGINFILKKRSV